MKQQLYCNWRGPVSHESTCFTGPWKQSRYQLLLIWLFTPLLEELVGLRLSYGIKLKLYLCSQCSPSYQYLTVDVKHNTASDSQFFSSYKKAGCCLWFLLMSFCSHWQAKEYFSCSWWVDFRQLLFKYCYKRLCFSSSWVVLLWALQFLPQSKHMQVRWTKKSSRVCQCPPKNIQWIIKRQLCL